MIFAAKKIRRILLGLAVLCIALLLYILWLPWVPNLKTRNPGASALQNLRVRQAAQKGKSVEIEQSWRDLEEISPNLIHAVLLAEDDVFYKHHGFDLEQIRIAFKMNWQKKRYVYGGSTLTQQLARTLYLSPKKSIVRKLNEAVITIWMEQILSKRRILEIYLNAVEWGDGVYGAEAAARHYYGKGSADLTPEEAVALASILPSPRKWSPLKTTPFMAWRRGGLLERMKTAGYIPEPAALENEKVQVIEAVPEEEESEAPVQP